MKPVSDRERSGELWVVAVTGGIGSGKSHVAQAFARLGARIIDADAMARELIESAALREPLEQEFGSAIFTSEGDLDRAALAARVFSDPAALARLGDIVHPGVRERIDKDLAGLRQKGSDEASPLPGKRPLVLLDIPLLETSPYHDLADVVLYVDAPKSDRLRRVSETRGWSEEELTRREASQVSLEEKRRRADQVLPNPDDAEDELAEACRALVQEWSERLSDRAP